MEKRIWNIGFEKNSKKHVYLVFELMILSWQGYTAFTYECKVFCSLSISLFCVNAEFLNTYCTSENK